MLVILEALRPASSWLEPPGFEDRDQQRRATLLHAALLLMILVVSLVALLTPWVYPAGRSALAAYATYAALLSAALTGLWLLGRGKLDAVSIGLPLTLWLSLSIAAWWLGGLRSSGVFLYPTIVLLAGFLVDLRAAFGIALLCAATSMGFGLAEHFGSLPVPEPISLVRRWTSLSTALIVAVTVVWLVLGSLETWADEAASSERKFERLFEGAPDGIVSLGPAGRVDSLNPAAEAILGVQANEASGRRLAELLPNGGAETRAALERILRSEDGGPVLLELRGARGEPTWVEVNSRSQANAHGVRAVELTLRNVSARVAAEAERRSLEVQLNESRQLESVGRLAGGIAHDFNNLLTVIQGNAELLMEEPQGEGWQERIDEVNEAAHQAAGLTRQLLAFASRQVLEPQWVELSEAVRGIEPILARLAGESIELKLDLAEALGTVRADPTQLQQVLINLVTNARDAMPYGGRIRVETARASADERATMPDAHLETRSWLRLRVEDEGTGMDEETLAAAFQPFFTRKETGRGTGLGLASVYGIVRQSGGHVHVESRLGQGSVFTVYLPEHDHRAAPRLDDPTLPLELAGSETILLVEDDPAVRHVIERMLARAGYRVLVAGSGDEALAACEASAPPIDLLLTDVEMPGLSGPRLARRLMRRMPDLRVVFLSGHAEATVISAASEDPRSLFLAKPPARREMLAKLRQAMASPPRDDDGSCAPRA